MQECADVWKPQLQVSRSTVITGRHPRGNAIGQLDFRSITERKPEEARHLLRYAAKYTGAESGVTADHATLLNDGEAMWCAPRISGRPSLRSRN
jgi:hypothetical protein